MRHRILNARCPLEVGDAEVLEGVPPHARYGKLVSVVYVDGTDVTSSEKQQVVRRIKRMPHAADAPFYEDVGRSLVTEVELRELQLD